MTKTRTKSELLEEYQSRPMLIEIVDGLAYAWPKGTRQRHAISVVGAWQHAQTRGLEPGSKVAGMTARRFAITE